MANLYFNEELGLDAFAEGALVEVVGDEARHAVRVSRLRAGERIAVGNGAGTIGEGAVEETAKERFTVRLAEVRRGAEPAPRIVLVQALAKGDRDERAVEQATEFGVDAIVPWEAERSVSRWNGAEKAERGVQKWRRIAREASKQSLRSRIPEVRDPETLAGLCALAGRDGTEVIVLHPRAAVALSADAAQLGEASEIMLVIGPEGGLSDRELDELEAAGSRIATLGSTVLRTSSAGPAALAVLNVALSRW